MEKSLVRSDAYIPEWKLALNKFILKKYAYLLPNYRFAGATEHISGILAYNLRSLFLNSIFSAKNIFGKT
jgi:hypothetical protein